MDLTIASNTVKVLKIVKRAKELTTAIVNRISKSGAKTFNIKLSLLATLLWVNRVNPYSHLSQTYTYTSYVYKYQSVDELIHIMYS